jgi:dUTP pyrophosphatase
MINIKLAKVKPNAIIPTKGSKFAAGFDMYACIEEEIAILPHTTAKIGTGISITPPEGFFGAIFARSGLATKQGLRPANCVGVCDEDYTGEYIVAIHNDGNEVQSIKPGDRIAQLVFLPYIDATFEEVDELTQTERGDGGFGSTGK